MFAIVQNGQIIRTIQPHTEFELNGRVYNAKWTVRMSLEDRAQLGITDVVSMPRPDERFYWVQDNPLELIDGVPTLTYTAFPKALEDITETPEGSDTPVTTIGLKTQWIAQVKAQAGSLLSASDWVIIRKAERGVEVPAAIAAERAAIVADCDAKEAAIQACTSVEELKEVLFPSTAPEQPLE